MNGGDSNSPQPPAPPVPPVPPRRPCGFYSWALLPLISGILFIHLVDNFADRIELDKFTWPPVLTNVMATASNAVAHQYIDGALLQPGSTSTVTANKPASSGYSGAVAGANSPTPAILGSVASQPDRLTQELTIRMLWAVSAVVFASLCCVLGAYVFLVLKEVLRPSGASLGFGLLGLLVLFYILRSLADGPISAISGGNAAEQLFQVMGAESGPAASVRDLKILPVKEVRNLISLLYAVANFALICEAIGACVILWVMRKEQDQYASLSAPTAQDADRAKYKYERRIEITVSMLQLTACAFVAGVVQVYLLYQMASCHVVPELKTDVRSFGQNLASVSSLVYSGILVAVYLPLLMFQRGIGRELLESHGGMLISGGNTRYLAQLDDADPKKAPMIAAFLTVLSPVLVAFLTKLAQSLTDRL